MKSCVGQFGSVFSRAVSHTFTLSFLIRPGTDRALVPHSLQVSQKMRRHYGGAFSRNGSSPESVYKYIYMFILSLAYFFFFLNLFLLLQFSLQYISIIA